MISLYTTTKLKRALLTTNSNCLSQCIPVRTQSNKNTFNKDSNKINASLLGVIACGVLATLFYLKRDKNPFTIAAGRDSWPASAFCLDAATQTGADAARHRPGCVREKVQLSEELKEALERTDHRLLLFKEKHGIPGLSAAVHVNGRPVWSRGYGYSDVENLVPCTPNTVMRIASISKPITTSAVAMLWQEGKLNIDLPVQEYVPEFPIKNLDGKAVEITTRHIMSHMSGIRNYKKVQDKAKTQDSCIETEWYNKSHFSDMSSSLQKFKDDELFHAPNTHYLYSTLAWTLVSAAVESSANENFLTFMRNQVFTPYKLSSIQEELNDPLLPHRGRSYHRKDGSKLSNTPYVDNSYKWAGGGFVSNVLDVAKFGSTMLGFYQGVHLAGSTDRHILSQDTVEKLWSCQGERKANGICVGLGWFIQAFPNNISSTHNKEAERIAVFHSGGAVGASSHLIILPRGREGGVASGGEIPSGVVVAMIGNLESVSFQQLGLEIGEDIYSALYG